MSNPLVQHSVCDQTLANSYFPGSGSHHTLNPKKPLSSKIIVGKPRIGSKNDIYSNMFENAGSSPYYKGLTDQSLAIYKAAQAQLEPSTHYHRSEHPNNVPLASPECSRYYKGLMDYPLAINKAPPTCEDIVRVLEFTGQQEGIELPHNLAVKTVEKSGNNLRQAIRSFEATCPNKLPLEEDQVILTGWEVDISNIAKSTIEEQSTKQLYNLRRKLQNLMIHNVSPGFIFMCLEADLTSLVDEPLKPGVAKLCKEYNGEPEQSNNNERSKKNAISYLKIEEFIAKFMSWYKNSSGTSSEIVQLEAPT